MMLLTWISIQLCAYSRLSAVIWMYIKFSLITFELIHLTLNLGLWPKIVYTSDSVRNYSSVWLQNRQCCQVYCIVYTSDSVRNYSSVSLQNRQWLSSVLYCIVYTSDSVRYYSSVSLENRQWLSSVLYCIVYTSDSVRNYSSVWMQNRLWLSSVLYCIYKWQCQKL
jgi:hypothetical protein